MSRVYDFITDPATGVITRKELFSAGTHQESMEKVVKPQGPTPGYEVRARWVTEPDGGKALLLGEVLVGEAPVATDDLDPMDLKRLLTIAPMEGLKNMNSQMTAHAIRQSIRAHRAAKAAAKEVPPVKPEPLK